MRSILRTFTALFVLSAGFVITGELLGSLPAREVGAAPEARMVEGHPLVASGSASAARQPELSISEIAPVQGPAAASIAEGATADTVAPAPAGAGVPLDAVARLVEELVGAGGAARRIAVFGVRRNVGTTLSAIALARLLAERGRVVLIDLALGSPNLSVIAAEPGASGVAELARGAATVGQIITRDRFSGMHLITAGRPTEDAQAVIASQPLAIALEALARSYDHVVIDAGALPEIEAERMARLAPRAVLVTDPEDSAGALTARQHMLAAGFGKVSVLEGARATPSHDAAGGRVAA